MSVRIRSHKDVAYGLDNALQNLAPQPIVSNRNPSSNDSAPVGTIWINKAGNAYYVLTSVVGGVANWAAQESGSFSTLDITGASGTVLTVDSGDTSLGGDLDVAGTTSVVNLDVGGILSVTGTSGLTGDVTVTGDLTVDGVAGITVLGVRIIAGSGSPSGTVTAPQGSLYLNTAGSSSSTRAYINSNGGTTWVAVTTAS